MFSVPQSHRVRPYSRHPDAAILDAHPTRRGRRPYRRLAVSADLVGPKTTGGTAIPRLSAAIGGEKGAELARAPCESRRSAGQRRYVHRTIDLRTREGYRSSRCSDLAQFRAEPGTEGLEEKCLVSFLTSAPVPLTVVFTGDSVPALLKTCLDEKEETWRRRWAAEWLRKVFPAFRLWVLPPRPEPLTKQEQFRRQLTRGRYERQNREEAERFLEFWDKQKDARGRDGELRSIR